MQTKKHLNVAVGLILNEEQQIFIAQRPADKPHPHCWEFPGGKVEEKESVEEALKRELKEEVGIDVKAAELFQKFEHEYETYHVTLHTFFVREFSGVAHGREGQPTRWINPTDLIHYTFPAANHPLVQALLLL